MVDARMPERYLSDRRIGRLTDSEFRSYVTAMIWSVSNRTDGVVVVDDLPLIPLFSTSAVIKFMALALWIEVGDGRWMIADFEQTQTSKHELEVLDNMRKRDREKKQRQRLSKTTGGPSFEDVPGDVPGDVSPGQDRQAGKAGQGLRAVPKAEQEWPTKQIPRSSA